MTQHVCDIRSRQWAPRESADRLSAPWPAGRRGSGVPGPAAGAQRARAEPRVPGRPAGLGGARPSCGGTASQGRAACAWLRGGESRLCDGEMLQEKAPQPSLAQGAGKGPSDEGSLLPADVLASTEWVLDTLLLLAALHILSQAAATFSCLFLVLPLSFFFLEIHGRGSPASEETRQPDTSLGRRAGERPPDKGLLRGGRPPVSAGHPGRAGFAGGRLLPDSHWPRRLGPG
ncbi:uncharacterized protein LOC120406358 [Mauremys reevesii]|uniref:uncharacterized protein LOC120406358 n=1 Tax=Mauremys reevesii TaxID=260615 RepID=UPI00193F0034|nr:uncharacterized protein LOC120406358 [Mauremys reevesii]